MAIVAAVDGEQQPAQPVEVGYELAFQFDEELVVLHVMDQEIFDRRRRAVNKEGAVETQSVTPVVYDDQNTQPASPSGSTNPYTIEDAEKDAANIAHDVLERTLDDWQNVTCQGRVGEPTKEILDEATRRDANYLVIGGRKRSPVGKAMFGSITQSILLAADRPVVTVMAEED